MFISISTLLKTAWGFVLRRCMHTGGLTSNKNNSKSLFALIFRVTVHESFFLQSALLRATSSERSICTGEQTNEPLVNYRMYLKFWVLKFFLYSFRINFKHMLRYVSKIFGILTTNIYHIEKICFMYIFTLPVSMSELTCVNPDMVISLQSCRVMEHRQPLCMQFGRFQNAFISPSQFQNFSDLLLCTYINFLLALPLRVLAWLMDAKHNPRKSFLPSIQYSPKLAGLSLSFMTYTIIHTSNMTCTIVCQVDLIYEAGIEWI